MPRGTLPICLHPGENHIVFRDILLPLVTYPDAVEPGAVDTAVRVAAAMGASLTGLAAEIDITMGSNVVADMVLDVQGMAREAESRSRAAAAARLEQLARQAGAAGVTQTGRSVWCVPPAVPDLFIRHARLHDLTLLPLRPGDGLVRWYAEELVFGAGRPVLVVPEDDAHSAAFARVTVAWDFSRAAARALADALPLLTAASAVHLVCVSDEKDVEDRDPELIAAHLKRHDVDFAYTEVRAAGRSIHDAIRGYAVDVSSDLLVMGAFGHSRLRQFVLGGATRSVLEAPYMPTLLVH
jgi:nucleotide-binding universal stress UspA family protein